MGIKVLRVLGWRMSYGWLGGDARTGHIVSWSGYKHWRPRRSQWGERRVSCVSWLVQVLSELSSALVTVSWCRDGGTWLIGVLRAEWRVEESVRGAGWRYSSLRPNLLVTRDQCQQSLGHQTLKKQNFAKNI